MRGAMRLNPEVLPPSRCISTRWLYVELRMHPSLYLSSHPLLSPPTGASSEFLNAFFDAVRRTVAGISSRGCDGEKKEKRDFPAPPLNDSEGDGGRTISPRGIRQRHKCKILPLRESYFMNLIQRFYLANRMRVHFERKRERGGGSKID